MTDCAPCNLPNNDEILPNYKYYVANGVAKILPSFAAFFSLNDLDSMLIVLLKLIQAKFGI